MLSSEGCLELDFSCFPQQSSGVKDQDKPGLPRSNGPTSLQHHFQVSRPYRRLLNTLSLPGHVFICKMTVFQSGKRHTSRAEFSQLAPARQVARAFSLILFSYRWVIWIHPQNGVKSILLNFVSVVKNSKTETRLKWTLMTPPETLPDHLKTVLSVERSLPCSELGFVVLCCGGPCIQQPVSLGY